jgi:hypothetical protein
MHFFVLGIDTENSVCCMLRFHFPQRTSDVSCVHGEIPHLRFLCGAVDLNTKWRKILTN